MDLKSLHTERGQLPALLLKFFKLLLLRRQPLIGVSSMKSLPVIAKSGRSKALFVFRFSPEVTAHEVCKTLKEQLSLGKLACTRLKTKFNSYSSFHVSVTEDEFSLISDARVWLLNCSLLW
jgi:hypothetical protein